MKNKTKRGSKAIPFNSKDINGNLISLDAYKGKKVYLSFFRKAACPFCNMGIQDLIRNYSKLQEKGIEVIAFFASSNEEVMKYAGEQNPPFSIIADPDYRIYNQYGIDISYQGMLKTMLNPKKVYKAMTGGFFSLRTTIQDPVIPADFLIDENQKIHKAYYGVDYDDHLVISEVINWN